MEYVFSEGLVKLKERAKKRKGRGFVGDERSDRQDILYEGMETDEADDEPGPQRCEYYCENMLLLRRHTVVLVLSHE